jgi:hypothetical protein
VEHRCCPSRSDDPIDAVRRRAIRTLLVNSGGWAGAVLPAPALLAAAVPRCGICRGPRSSRERPDGDECGVSAHLCTPAPHSSPSWRAIAVLAGDRRSGGRRPPDLPCRPARRGARRPGRQAARAPAGSGPRWYWPPPASTSRPWTRCAPCRSPRGRLTRPAEFPLSQEGTGAAGPGSGDHRGTVRAGQRDVARGLNAGTGGARPGARPDRQRFVTGHWHGRPRSSSIVLA